MEQDSLQVTFEIVREELIERLKDLFNQLSEWYWSAGWADGLDFHLWSDLSYLRDNDGHMTDEEFAKSGKLWRDDVGYIKALKRIGGLSEYLKGWIFWDESNTEDVSCDTFIPIDEWLEYYDKNKKDFHY